MAHIHEIIVYKSIVGVAACHDDIRRVLRLGPVVIKDVLHPGQEDACQLLLQDVVGRLLEVRVNGQVHVVPRLWLRLPDRVDDPAHAVHVELHFTLVPLERAVQHLLQTGFTHRVCQVVLLLFLLAEGIVLLLGYLARVSDQIGKVFAVCIPPQ